MGTRSDFSFSRTYKEQNKQTNKKFNKVFKETFCRSAIKSKGGMGARKGLGLGNVGVIWDCGVYGNLPVFQEQDKSADKCLHLSFDFRNQSVHFFLNW